MLPARCNAPKPDNKPKPDNTACSRRLYILSSQSKHSASISAYADSCRPNHHLARTYETQTRTSLEKRHHLPTHRPTGTTLRGLQNHGRCLHQRRHPQAAHQKGILPPNQRRNPHRGRLNAPDSIHKRTVRIDSKLESGAEWGSKSAQARSNNRRG